VVAKHEPSPSSIKPQLQLYERDFPIPSGRNHNQSAISMRYGRNVFPIKTLVKVCKQDNNLPFPCHYCINVTTVLMRPGPVNETRACIHKDSVVGVLTTDQF
jgi:hypothetical protein